MEGNSEPDRSLEESKLPDDTAITKIANIDTDSHSVMSQAEYRLYIERITAELRTSAEERGEEQKVSLARHEALVFMQSERLLLVAESVRYREYADGLEQQCADLGRELAERDQIIVNLQEAANLLAAESKSATRLIAALEHDVDELRAAILYIRSRAAERDRITADGV